MKSDDILEEPEFLELDPLSAEVVPAESSS
jgi:hypothetical protein